MTKASPNLATIISDIINDLPPLSSVIRYSDNYTDEWHSIRNPEVNHRWPIVYNGQKGQIDFSVYSPSVSALLKRYFAWRLGGYSSNTVINWSSAIKNTVLDIGEAPLIVPLESTPLELKAYWHRTIVPYCESKGRPVSCFKSYLLYLCEFSLGELNPGYCDFISGFSHVKADLYAAVRNAEGFISEEEENFIISYLDDLSIAAQKNKLDTLTLREACILIASYQYAMRPIQIAKLTIEDVLVRMKSAETISDPIVHVRFTREKQASANKRVPLLRKIKREWAILYKQFAATRQVDAVNLSSEGAVPNSFFGLSPLEVGMVIKCVTEKISGIQRTATDLRHAGAQRMADAGASHEEMAEYLGHISTRTGLIYYSASATQAERLNKALATSAIFTGIVKIHRTKTIDEKMLTRLSQANQIGGVPHGVPIAGIGACQLGQALCSKNPVMSCYGCRKFLPVHDVAVHENVRDTLRPVVHEFYHASKGETNSPAYTQLRRTIAGVEQVIFDIKQKGSDVAESEL